MTLIVGTNTYVSEAEATTYIAMVGGTELTGAESLLTQATLAIDRLYGGRFLGRKQTSTQPLQWPRSGNGQSINYDQGWYSSDADGNPRDFGIIAVELKQATIEMAMLLDDFQNPYAQPEPKLTSEKVKIAVIEVDQAFKDASGYAADPLYKISLILRPLLTPGGVIRFVR